MTPNPDGASCAPQPYRTIMVEPRAPVGSQAQPHLEDGTTYYPRRPTQLDKIENLHSTDSIDNGKLRYSWAVDLKAAG